MDQEHYCNYVSSVGLRKSCNITSLIDSRYIDEYDFSKLKENDILYLKLDKIPAFSRIISTLNVKFILVSGCSDYTTPIDLFRSEEDFLNFIESKNIIHWFVQNCIITHNKISLLPIGLDFHTMSEKDMEWGNKISPINQENILQKIKLKTNNFWDREIKCYSNYHFQINTKYGFDRRDAFNQIPKDLVYYEPIQIKRIHTWMNQINFAFVISPHGNGLDCHRTWEALILGCIVIVKTSPIDKLYDNLPVLIVNEWSDINEQLLNDTVQNFKDKQFNYDKLTLNYWVDKFKSYKI